MVVNNQNPSAQTRFRLFSDSPLHIEPKGLSKFTLRRDTAAIKALRSIGERIKGDERILSDGDFVESILRAGNERLERRAFLQATGYDFDRLVKRVAALFEMPATEVLREGKYARTVQARSALCFWANRELGISTVELARRLKIVQPTVTQSIARGEKVVAEKQLLMSADMQ